ncbi:D-tagatose-bisphosphate aldolase, class II, non-catalytic subunit [Polycladidibacter stylochi]|uniref:D-tagatose-bisphosphate aldolase, class II, non-catalytic subunit n=1 Tax=Polycladidibacter stylochi TaxID=1807766 RepID=UPI00083536B9|nr:D-tagatose-bisphosphate aldolase, class II, non-catalytic subunit [Pseudovibrio stylochi]
MKTIIEKQDKGLPAGICSVCSASPLVIEAALRFDLETDRTVLIEATSNQVNQFGGYTGMKPVDFREFVFAIADKIGFPRERICLGGDHLGPNTWRDKTPEEAMQLSCTLVADYVKAGFRKIHLDASMAVLGETDPLDPAVVAERAADMCVAAEEACTEGEKPLYIVGTEVPVPGGETDGLTGIQISKVPDVKETIELHRKAFEARGLQDAFTRVIGVVVQPGVDFDHTSIIAYDRPKAKELAEFIADQKGLVFEAHSTDYQPKEKFRELVEDHFAILKVGPALTFALREGLFALAAIEDELVSVEKRSQLRSVMERVMLDEPGQWQRYYQGNASAQKVLRGYSNSDRIRYYWPQEDVQSAVEKLMQNLNETTMIDSLVRQYAGLERARLQDAGKEITAQNILLDKVQQILEDYRYGCQEV